MGKDRKEVTEKGLKTNAAVSEKGQKKEMTKRGVAKRVKGECSDEKKTEW